MRHSTVYPKKYAHGFCFAVLCCGYTLTDFPISIRLTSLALWQSNDCPSASKATLMNMDKYFMWIHYERLHNHNKAKHNKTVCIFLGIYCIWLLGKVIMMLVAFMLCHTVQSATRLPISQFTFIPVIYLNDHTIFGVSFLKARTYPKIICFDNTKNFQGVLIWDRCQMLATQIEQHSFLCYFSNANINKVIRRVHWL